MNLKSRELSNSVISFLGSLLFWTIALGLNFPAALALMSVFLFHELGHYFAALKLRAQPVLPVFIVLVAFVRFETDPGDLRKRFLIAGAGPFFGSIAAALLLLVKDDSFWMLAAAGLAFIVNLVQLVPLPPFDGGHMVMAIDRRLWKVGVIAIVIYAIAGLLRGDIFPASALALMWPTCRKQMRSIEQQAALNPAAFTPSVKDRLGYGVAYFALVGVLSVLVANLPVWK